MHSPPRADAALQPVLSCEAVAALAAIPVRRRLTLFNFMEAITLFPYDGEELPGEGRKQPTFTRCFGEWRVVWWVDMPVGEVQVLLIDRRHRR